MTKDTPPPPPGPAQTQRRYVYHGRPTASGWGPRDGACWLEKTTSSVDRCRPLVDPVGRALWLFQSVECSRSRRDPWLPP